MNMYQLGLDQLVNAIATTGTDNTILVQGHMGTGKSSLLTLLAKKFPNHIACYFDCTNKDLGDITIPNIAKLDDGTGFVTYLTNEELGAHLDLPIILMIDEFGKANPAVQNALTRPMLEHKIGSYTLHKDSIVFATTNLGAEGVGDMFKDHHKNRITVVQSRKPTAEEWITYGINHGFDASILSFAKEFPQIFQSFDEVKNPDDNPYIFHPKQKRDSFFTPRSGEKASKILLKRDHLDEQTLTAMLSGTIGQRTALDLMAYVSLMDQLPRLQEIKDNPETAKVPDSASAICMVVYRTLSTIDRSWVDAWMTYLPRLPSEAQGLFGNGVRAPQYANQALVMTNAKFTQWAMDNSHLFSADKR